MLSRSPSRVRALHGFNVGIFCNSTAQVSLLRSTKTTGTRILVGTVSSPRAGLRLARVIGRRFPRLRVVTHTHSISRCVHLHRTNIRGPRHRAFRNTLGAKHLTLRDLNLKPCRTQRHTSIFHHFGVRVIRRVTVIRGSAGTHTTICGHADTVLDRVVARSHRRLSLVRQRN